MCKRESRASRPVKATAVAAVTTVLSSSFAASGIAFAAPQTALPQQATTVSPRAAKPAAPVDLVEAARQVFEAATARRTAGIDNAEEWEQARYGLALAIADSRLSQARIELERHKSDAAAGVSSYEAVLTGTLAVSEREVDLEQVQTDHVQQVAARLKAKSVAGIISQREADTATKQMGAAQTRLAAAKARYTAQKIELYRNRLGIQQAQYQAGIGEYSEVAKAKSDYEAALAESVKIK